MRRLRAGAPALFAAALAGCQGVQSALTPLGPEAERVALLFWVLTIGGGAIFAAVMAFVALAIHGGDRPRAWFARERAIVIGGIVFPVVVLTLLLGYGLQTMRAGQASPGEEEPLRITVVGEQWWWRVIYSDPDGAQFESANEVRIPTGRRVEVSLVSADVIHSFWVPNLAGKVDMIPGRTNTLTLAADRPGVSRGQCAEYCGGPHALMAFNVVAMAPEEFAAWLAREAGPATPGAAGAGELLFLSSGCGACHAIRGTAANGTIGPDLTHVGSRLSLAAATLPNNADALASWIVGNQHIKPENRMPAYGIFSDAELSDLSAYLAGLR